MDGFGRKLDVEKWIGKNIMVTNASESFLGRLSSCGELGLAVAPHGIPDQMWLFPWASVQRVDLVVKDGVVGEFPSPTDTTRW
jgi:hypothetical protein